MDMSDIYEGKFTTTQCEESSTSCQRVSRINRGRVSNDLGHKLDFNRRSLSLFKRGGKSFLSLFLPLITTLLFTGDRIKSTDRIGEGHVISHRESSKCRVDKYKTTFRHSELSRNSPLLALVAFYGF